MSRSKLLTVITLITLAFAVALVGDALAGEKFKCRVVWYWTKAESINVPGEEGRIMLIREDKGILTVSVAVAEPKTAEKRIEIQSPK